MEDVSTGGRRFNGDCRRQVKSRNGRIMDHPLGISVCWCFAEIRCGWKKIKDRAALCSPWEAGGGGSHLKFGICWIKREFQDKIHIYFVIYLQCKTLGYSIFGDNFQRWPPLLPKAFGLEQLLKDCWKLIWSSMCFKEQWWPYQKIVHLLGCHILDEKKLLTFWRQLWEWKKLNSLWITLYFK